MSTRYRSLSVIRRQLSKHIKNPPRMSPAMSLRQRQEYGRRYRAWVTKIARLRHALADAMVDEGSRLSA